MSLGHSNLQRWTVKEVSQGAIQPLFLYYNSGVINTTHYTNIKRTMNIFQKSFLFALAAAPLTFAGAPAQALPCDLFNNSGTCEYTNGSNNTTTTVNDDSANQNVDTRNNQVSDQSNDQTNSQSINIQDAPEAVVAPTPNPTAPGQVGDVIVPLPTVGVSAFGSRDNNVFGGDTERSTVGVQAGFSIPLGTGQTRRAAEQVIARRDSAMRFQLIQEAAFMLQAGVLSEEVHPEHWAALYGTSLEVAPFEAE